MKLLTPESERELVARLYARDERAMAFFYNNYRPALLSTIGRIVRHPPLAEDTLQEAMLKFWLSFPSYDSRKGRLFTWALNICRNLAIDRLREQRVRAATNQPLDEQGTFVAPTTFQPEHIGVRDWLGLVSATDRQLLDLLYLQGYTQQEVADRLHLPLGTVKTRAYRVLRQLGQAMR